MWCSIMLITVFIARAAECFVYSCDEIINTLMNSDFEQYSTHAYVITQDGFTNWDQLKQIRLVLGEYEYSFADIAKKNTPFVTNDLEGMIPWRISGGNPTTNCDREFTLILKSDELGVFKTPKTFGKFSDLSGVFVVPQCGMWFCKMSMSGEGNVSVYSGAGTGEEEDRFLLQTWSEITHVTVNMNLLFDTENKGTLKIQEQAHYDGAEYPFYNGTHTEVFATDFFEIIWHPTLLEPSQISRNQDDINVEIQLSHMEDGCPDRYSIVTDSANQSWCYVIIWPVPPIQGYTFSDAVSLCNSRGDSLPIVTSDATNYALLNFASIHLANKESVWLGIVCDSDNNSWMWQDGQDIKYRNFYTDPGFKCSESIHFALDTSLKWGEYVQDKIFTYTICARGLASSTSSVASEEPFSSVTTVSHPSTSESSTNDHEDVTTGPETTTSTSASSITSTQTQNTGLTLWTIVLIVVCVILICGCLIIVIIVSRKKIVSLRAEVVEEKLDKVKKVHQPPHSRYYDAPNRNNEWEIDRRFVSIDYMHMLGEGAFGSVYLGRVLAKNIPSVKARSILELSAMTNNNDMVAVKMIHENADFQTEREFLAEIELMKKIGYHERLVNMLACVTISEPILLICEYCANGDLLEYLRQRRQFMIENPDDTNSGKVITVKKQLMFAIQIAYGLEFLSARGYIHRDVAARNIMVDQQESCKIGDFGLGRSVGRENENYHAQGGKLPLKWMSPEAIDKYYFSTSTDVWSFGILLFEVVTLGGTPYAGWPAAELLKRLKHGERMDKPDNCSVELYKLMSNCWSENPSHRPTFTSLRKKVGDVLENVTNDEYYLKLNPHAHYYALESNASD